MHFSTSFALLVVALANCASTTLIPIPANKDDASQVQAPHSEPDLSVPSPSFQLTAPVLRLAVSRNFKRAVTAESPRSAFTESGALEQAQSLGEKHLGEKKVHFAEKPSIKYIEEGPSLFDRVLGRVKGNGAGQSPETIPEPGQKPLKGILKKHPQAGTPDLNDDPNEQSSKITFDLRVNRVGIKDTRRSSSSKLRQQPLRVIKTPKPQRDQNPFDELQKKSSRFAAQDRHGTYGSTDDYRRSRVRLPGYNDVRYVPTKYTKESRRVYRPVDPNSLRLQEGASRTAAGRKTQRSAHGLPLEAEDGRDQYSRQLPSRLLFPQPLNENAKRRPDIVKSYKTDEWGNVYAVHKPMDKYRKRFVEDKYGNVYGFDTDGNPYLVGPNGARTGVDTDGDPYLLGTDGSRSGRDDNGRVWQVDQNRNKFGPGISPGRDPYDADSEQRRKPRSSTRYPNGG